MRATGTNAPVRSSRPSSMLRPLRITPCGTCSGGSIATMAPPHSKFCPPGLMKGPAPPICSPASWPPTPGNSPGSGRRRQACWPPTAPTVRSSPPGCRSSTSIPSAQARTPSTSVPRAAGSGNSLRSSWPRSATSAMPSTRARRRAGRAHPPCSPSTRWPTSPPCPISRPWSARAVGRACWCWPACRTSPRPAAAGARRRTASSRSSARRWCCPASRTRGRYAT